MPEQKAATLATIFSDVLADLAFMFTEDEEATSNPDEVWLETKIGYRGPVNGELRFRCTREFSRLLASNLLGVVAEEAGDEQADDAAKEFMNIVCGQLVTALHGTEAIFNLTIPEIRKIAEMPDFTLNDGGQAATVTIEGQNVQLLYELGDGQR